MSSSPRKSLVAAILAALPRGVDDGAVSVVHAGELVTVTLTLPGAGRPLVTATVRRPAPASDAERQLAIPAAAVPARRPSVPPSAEAPATTAATATNDEPRLVAPIVVPPIAPPGRVLRVGDAVFEGDLTWVVELVDVERSLVTLSCNGRTQTVDRTHITLDSADLWRHPAADVSTSPLTVAEERALAADAAALPETRAAAPTEIFSVEIDGAEVDGSDEDSARWAERHGLRWVCGGCLFWHVEGGCSDVTRLRMVSAVPSAHAAELLDLCESEGLEARVTPHKGADHTLLHAGSFVFEDSASDVLAGWAVTETPKRGELIRLARGATESSVDLARLRRFTNGSGAWRIAAARSAKTSKVAAKTPAKKAPAESPAKASTKPSKPGVSWAATRDASCAALLLATPGPCLIIHDDAPPRIVAQRQRGQTDATWLATVRVVLGAVEGLVWARLYSKSNACLWDSRDGGEPSTGPAPRVAAKKLSPGLGPAKIENPPVRAFVVRDRDLYELQKGLGAFNPMKDSYAGAASGGGLRPLAQMHTSRVASGDVEMLLSRLKRQGLPYLDLGTVLRDDLHEHQPDERHVRTAWNLRNSANAVQLDGIGWAASAVDAAPSAPAEAAPVGLLGNLAALAVTNRYTVCVRESEGNAWSRIGDGNATKGDAHQTARAAVLKYGHARVAMIDPDGALVRLPKPATQPTAEAPRRHGERRTPPRDDAANARALRGRHCIVGRTDEGWELAASREPGETHPAWHARAKALLAKYSRVRIYDAKPRCVWDSADAQGQSGGAS